MIEEKFSEGNSLIHNFDSRIKIISCLIFVFAVASLKDIHLSCVSFFLGIVFLSISNLLKKETISSLIKVNSFILFLWVIIPISTKGDTIFKLWIFNITKQGIYLCLNITLKSNAILMAIISFLLTQPTPVIGQALNSLKIPSKFCFLLLMSYRYINLIYSEYNRLMTAAKIRGFVPKTNIHTYKTIAYIFSMVLIKSYDRAQRIYQAMVLRGFKGKFYSLYEFSITPKDIIFAVLVFTTSISLVVFDLKKEYILNLWMYLFSA